MGVCGIILEDEALFPCLLFYGPQTVIPFFHLYGQIGHPGGICLESHGGRKERLKG